jgi:hypothetical protein
MISVYISWGGTLPNATEETKEDCMNLKPPEIVNFSLDFYVGVALPIVISKSKFENVVPG